MKARVEEMRASVISAEAQIPLAMADAFRSGNLGIMDLRRNTGTWNRTPTCGVRSLRR